MKAEAIINMTMPLTVVSAISLAIAVACHPVPFGYASLASMLVGACLLGAARWPLYRQRRFFSWGSKGLDRMHRTMYRCAYLMLWAGITLALLLIASHGW